jgi:hypothetical protein
VHRIDETGTVVQGGDDQAAGAGAVGFELDALEQQTVGDARGGKDHVLAAGQFMGFVDPVGIADAHFRQASQVAFPRQPLPFLRLGHGRVVDELTLEMAAEATHGRGGDDTFRSRSNPHQRMGARAVKSAGDGGADIAVADGLDPGTGSTDLSNQTLVACPVHADDDQLVDPEPQALRQDLQVFSGGVADVNLALGRRGSRQLVHVEVGSVEQAPSLAGGQNGHGTVLGVGAEIGSLAGIDGKIHTGAHAAADLLTDVQHRRLVTLSLADDDPTLHGDLPHAQTHGLDSRLVSLVLFTVAGEMGRSDGSLLNDFEQFLDDGAIHGKRAREKASGWTGKGWRLVAGAVSPKPEMRPDVGLKP